jgi:hypothetical protein
VAAEAGCAAAGEAVAAIAGVAGEIAVRLHSSEAAAIRHAPRACLALFLRDVDSMISRDRSNPDNKKVKFCLRLHTYGQNGS